MLLWRKCPNLVYSILVCALGITGCSRCGEHSNTNPAHAPPELEQKELTWEYPNTPVGPVNVVVALPRRTHQERFPVLIALHGKGESQKGPARGARGWLDDYGLLQAQDRLRHPPLTRRDFFGFVEDERLTKLNTGLQTEPYTGLIVVCPYLPDSLTLKDLFTQALPLAQFYVDELLPRVHRETPALTNPEHTGIDGVSLGGRAALAIGLLKPNAFGAVAALQAALTREVADEVAHRMKAAHLSHRNLHFRLLSSQKDPFLTANRALSEAATRLRVPHEFLVVPGPHNYEFNRGPGVIEMLSYHDRVLRQRPTL